MWFSSCALSDWQKRMSLLSEWQGWARKYDVGGHDLVDVVSNVEFWLR